LRVLRLYPDVFTTTVTPIHLKESGWMYTELRCSYGNNTPELKQLQ